MSLAFFIEHGPWGLALASFMAGTVFPLPSEPVLVALVALGRDPRRMALIATLANVLGAVTLMLIARKGRAFAERRVSRENLARAEEQFRLRGVWLLLFSWLPVVGDALVLAAGLLNVPWRQAVPLLALGKGARYLVVAFSALLLR